MRQRLPLFRTLVAATALFAVAIVAVASFGRVDRVVTARGRLTGGVVEVRAPRAGRIARVVVPDGERVESGAVLVVLETEPLAAEADEIRARLTSLEAEASATREKIGGARSSRHPAEIAEARARVEKAEMRSELMDSASRATIELGKQGLASRLDVERAQNERKLALADLDEARQARALLDARHEAEIRELEAQLERIAAEMDAHRVRLDEVRRRMEESRVRAPIGGTVASERESQMLGRAVTRGESILSIETGTATGFRGVLSDAGRAATQPGQTARVRLDGYPWLVHGSAAARVLRIGAAESAGGFAVHLVVDEDGAPGPLRDGMRGEARIIVEKSVPVWRLVAEEVLESPAP